MVKITLLTLLLMVSLEAFSQVDVNKPVLTTPASGLDPSVTGRAIMDKLTPTLALNTDQTSKVTILVGKFLTHKSDFMKLKETNLPEYRKKLNEEQLALFDGMKEVLTPDQYKRLQATKPASFDTEVPISHLFF